MKYIPIESAQLKTALKSWVLENTDIPSFSKMMNYTYQHGWNLVSNKAPVTDSLIGRFALAYGPEALAEWFSIAKNSYSSEKR